MHALPLKNPTGFVPLTTACPVGSSGKLLRYAGKSPEWTGIFHSWLCHSQMCRASRHNARPGGYDETIMILFVIASSFLNKKELPHQFVHSQQCSRSSGTVFCWPETSRFDFQAQQHHNKTQINNWESCFIHSLSHWLKYIYGLIHKHRTPNRGAEDDKTVSVSVLLLEVQHLWQRKLWAHVSIHDKKCFWTPRQNLISEMIDSSSGAQSRVLLKVSEGISKQ